MPYQPDDPLAIPQLFNHRYDIDPLIAAFASSHMEGEWTLDTRTGTLTPPDLPKPPPDPLHTYTFTPLPHTFHTTIPGHPAFRRLPQNRQDEITEILKHFSQLSDAIDCFNNGFSGGFIRERIKEAVLEWLDGHDLIPPSMRHVRQRQPAALSAIKKVTIQS